MTESIFANSRPWRASVAVAIAFAAQAAICVALLRSGYSYAGATAANEVGWAIVSAFLVLQPEFSQSLAIAFSRMAANLIGALAGLIVAKTIGTGAGGMIVAVALASIGCGLLRLDLALRTAAVAIVIVMGTHQDILWSGAERFAAVTIGCATGIIVQLSTRPLTRHFETSPTIQSTPRQMARKASED